MILPTLYMVLSHKVPGTNLFVVASFLKRKTALYTFFVLSGKRPETDVFSSYR
jgi:hypothetical protein